MSLALSFSHLHNPLPGDLGRQSEDDNIDIISETVPRGQSVDGTWGERDVGGPLCREDAMADFEELRKEISRLSLERTKSRRSIARPPTRHSLTSVPRHRTSAGLSDVEKADLDPPESESDEDDFDLGQFIKDGQLEKRAQDGGPAKSVGVVFRNLTVKGISSSATFVKTLPQAIIGTFGPDLYQLIVKFMPILDLGGKPPMKDLIQDFTGVVRAGEILLVLGRPGAGCSTFLKAIANERESFAAVEGQVSYGGISAEDQRKYFRGEVNYNPEDDKHLPTLTVWQTLKFALMNKTRKHEKGAIAIIASGLMKIFGISHTKDTLVGDEYVRGISGGERKRVGIAETLATKSTVVCFDSSTRGLDASTALDFAKSLRVMTDISLRTTITTLYQAGEGIYELMDKVLVIEQGRMIYQGPANQAKQYFIDLGFDCPERQTTADFLSSIGDPNERKFRPGKELSTPRTAEELEAAFRRSDTFKAMLAGVEGYESKLRETSHADTAQFKEAVYESKSKSRLLTPRSSYTVSFPRQVLACTRREFWLFWGDKTTMYTKAFIIVSNALIVGSLFYGESLDTSGAFPRGGALFFSIVFLGWLQLSELMRALTGRVVIQRHREYAFYRPSAVVVARVLLDLPVLGVQVLIFGIIMYFMSSLDVVASKFWIYVLFVYIMTICLTALYRMFAALSPTIDDAVRFAGIGFNLLIIFAGYVIPKQNLVHQVPWFGTWLYYTNPISYAFEAVLSNEFSGRTMACSPSDLVPQGPDVDPRYQGCSLTGAKLGSTAVTGSDYIQASFEYTRSHLWRNFGVVIAFALLYVLITGVASEKFSFASGGGGAIVFKKTQKTKNIVQQGNSGIDEEAGPVESRKSSPASSSSLDSAEAQKEGELHDISQSGSVFTWENVEYSVPYGNGTRKLLNKVNGYVKPGVMIALMGVSGAGKTTLLNTLAQRQTTGVLAGQMLVDGASLNADFQRRTGFCEQLDLHESTATVREALEFSAILRQEASVPRAEKIAYVNKVISLLELHELEDAIIMSLGVEQRKRLTIGVELAAKPSLLLFLDEPTSGLDAQSAFSIVRFLKKLSQAGQAILCTIHQPSSILIQQFDMILALNPGGNTFYFGPVGNNGQAVIDYFAKRGVHCPPDKNVAEFILETAAKRGGGAAKDKDGKRLDWNHEWVNSEENQELLDEIQRLKSEGRSSRGGLENRGTTPKKSEQHGEEDHRKGGNESSTDDERPDPSSHQTAKTFAAPLWTQTAELTKRTFIAYSRDPSYLYAKLFVSVVIGLFNGFTFYNLPANHSSSSLQSLMFSCFLIVIIPPTIVNGVLPKFYSALALWQTREYPSRIYSWPAFCTAQVVAEVPMAVISGTLYWICWYLPAGLPRSPGTGGYVYLMTILFFLFQSSWGQWICSFAPSFTVISNVLPFFFVIFSLFNGVVRPYAQIPVFWHSWLYWLNPSTYWIGGVLAAVLGAGAGGADTTSTVQQPSCSPQTLVHFNPPPNSTCASYLTSLRNNISPAYLQNPHATADCLYCPPTTSGARYLTTLNIDPADKWRDLGIFAAFVLSNWGLVYFFIWTVRVKGWRFGFDWVFGGWWKRAALVVSKRKV